MADFQHENGILSPKNAKNLESPRKFRTFAVSKERCERSVLASENYVSGLQKFTTCPARKNSIWKSGKRELINHKPLTIKIIYIIINFWNSERQQASMIGRVATKVNKVEPLKIKRRFEL